eukprot:1155306-Pelagomonas_calceolata.AAC.5
MIACQPWGWISGVPCQSSARAASGVTSYIEGPALSVRQSNAIAIEGSAFYAWQFNAKSDFGPRIAEEVSSLVTQSKDCSMPVFWSTSKVSISINRRTARGPPPTILGPVRTINS